VNRNESQSQTSITPQSEARSDRKGAGETLGRLWAVRGRPRSTSNDLLVDDTPKRACSVDVGAVVADRVGLGSAHGVWSDGHVRGLTRSLRLRRFRDDVKLATCQMLPL
jgi:hypothetical protein